MHTVFGSVKRLSTASPPSLRLEKCRGLPPTPQTVILTPRRKWRAETALSGSRRQVHVRQCAGLAEGDHRLCGDISAGETAPGPSITQLYPVSQRGRTLDAGPIY